MKKIKLAVTLGFTYVKRKLFSLLSAIKKVVKIEVKSNKKGVVVYVKDISKPDSAISVILETFKAANADKGVIFDPFQKPLGTKKPKSKTLRKRSNRNNKI